MENSLSVQLAACKAEKELFKLWKRKPLTPISYIENKKQKNSFINHSNVFIEDGVIDENIWNSQKGKKILFVLKEAYNGSEDWSLPDWLRQCLDNNEPFSSMWKRVIEWIYAVKNTSADNIAPYAENICDANRNLLRHAAVMNLKKSSGRSNSSYGEIAAYAKSDKEYLKRQLEIIAPDIIICGATFKALNEIFNMQICPPENRCENWFYFTKAAVPGKSVLVVDYYHPANHYPALVNYYAVASIYQQALKEDARKTKLILCYFF